MQSPAIAIPTFQCWHCSEKRYCKHCRQLVMAFNLSHVAALDHRSGVWKIKRHTMGHANFQSRVYIHSMGQVAVPQRYPNKWSCPNFQHLNRRSTTVYHKILYKRPPYDERWFNNICRAAPRLVMEQNSKMAAQELLKIKMHFRVSIEMHYWVLIHRLLPKWGWKSENGKKWGWGMLALIANTYLQ